MIPVLPCYNGLFLIKIKHQTGERKKFQGRAYSRNIGRYLILGARKSTFFKKGHQKFYPPFNAFCPNNALYNFCKRGQHSTVKCKCDTSLQNFQEWKLVFSGISSSRGFLKNVWKFKKLEQYKEQMVVLFWLCLVYAFANLLHLLSVNKSPLYILSMIDVMRMWEENFCKYTMRNF